jgi:hypothetical protein
MAVALNDVLSRLQGVKKSGNDYTALCPAHDDKTASLSIKEGERGKVLLHCHADCTAESVAGALGFAMRDLMGEDKKPQYSGAVEVARYRYGQFTKVRKSDKSFYWTPKLNGADPGLYNAAALGASDYVFVVEGEKDVETLKKCGLPGVCSAFGAGNGNKWRREYNDLFAGKRVYICPDNDDIGYSFAELERENIATTAAHVQVLDLLAVFPQLQNHGDISDIYAAVGKEGTLDILRKAQKLPPPGRTESGNGLDNRSNNHYDNYTIAGAEKQAVFAEFMPFEQSEQLPPFPLDALPPATREFIHSAAEMVQAPVEMVGACVLGALEIACRGRYLVRLPNGHIERPCLYIAPIAPPSERKSGVTDVITKPLIDFEIEYNQDHGGEVNQSKSELKLLQGRIANAEQTAIKAKKSEDRLIAEHELADLNAELAEFEATDPLRLFGADVTPEKLAAMLKGQCGTFALVSAEGGGLFENIGRYSDKGGLEVYLNGYSGDRVCVDRKNSESIVLDRPTLSIIAPCQPSVIADLFSDKQKTGRGLLTRILFVKCQSRVGSRKFMTSPIDERIERNYRNLVFGMLAAESKGELSYDTSGFDEYVRLFDEIEPHLNPDDGELAFMGDWAGKLPGNMTRFAGLIHCIAAFEQGNDPLDTRINAEEARAAVELARFFLAHAREVYSEQSEPQSITDAKYLWRRANALNTLEVTKTQIYRATQNYRKGAFSLDESLLELERRGYIRVAPVRKEGADRPITTIFINETVKQSAFSAITPTTKSKYTKYTQNTVIVPDVGAAADFPHFVEIPDGELDDELPFEVRL